MDNFKDENKDKDFDIHGSAKWGSYDDIQKANPGYKKHMKFFKILRDKSLSHILVLGPKGSGKGAVISQIGGLKIPNSLSFKNSKMFFVVNGD